MIRSYKVSILSLGRNIFSEKTNPHCYRNGNRGTEEGYVSFFGMTGASPATTIPREASRGIVVAGLAPVMQKNESHPSSVPLLPLR